mmetsp:Transcript_15849/g.37910  ORF Transcript_15849/g.37910 Transcript_15849/m.37910 type:complete len:229 (-) Transcript_15849:192-878(-)
MALATMAAATTPSCFITLSICSSSLDSGARSTLESLTIPELKEKLNNTNLFGNDRYQRLGSGKYAIKDASQDGELCNPIEAFTCLHVPEGSSRLLEHGKHVWSEQTGCQLVEHSIENERDDECRRTQLSRSIHVPRNGNQCIGFPSTLVRKCTDAIFERRCFLQRISEHRNIFQCRIRAKAKIGLDSMNGIAQKDGRTTFIDPRASISKRRKIGRRLLGHQGQGFIGN